MESETERKKKSSGAARKQAKRKQALDDAASDPKQRRLGFIEYSSDANTTVAPGSSSVLPSVVQPSTTTTYKIQEIDQIKRILLVLV